MASRATHDRRSPPGRRVGACGPRAAIARVEPLTLARAVRGPFDYRLPASMKDVGVGSVLLVPFGPRRLPGVVVEIAAGSELPPERLAEPIAALGAGVPAELVRLALWLGREYCSTPARALQLVVPPGARGAGRGTRPRMELRATITEEGRAAGAAAQRLGARQRAVLAALREADARPAGPVDGLSSAELAAACGADRPALRRLEGRGLVRLAESEVMRRPRVAAVGRAGGDVRLTAEQRRATDAIGAAVAAGPPGASFLLWGVTGSGKTEVYMTAAEAALRRGRGVIVLVPEIALTPQTMARFRQRFGDSVALLHSGLAAGSRHDEWRRLRSGEARICVGPRSAVFAPLTDLGLLVVDEEHDPGYKQEGDPRYDAREVARRRAADAGAVLVAGTATPRPESWLELERLELPRRVDGRLLPSVELLDMRGADPRSGPLHDRTLEALEEVRRSRRKAIVLLNRRGWAPHLLCRSCGYAWTCPHCDVSLVLHGHARFEQAAGSRGRLVCHHCGHGEPAPRGCGRCGSVTLARAGAGTERLESLLAERLDPLPVLRLDSDSVGPARAHLEILRGFEQAPCGVLVGTQMVAKGHDFAGVGLSVVLDADATLRFPDFRAEERAFALVAQLAGRSGRGEAGARVLIQTLAPEAEPFRAAARHDAAGFLAGELKRRRGLGYPPFSSLIRVQLSAPRPEDAEAAAHRMREALEGALPPRAQLLGPAPRFRLRGRHRRQLLLKTADRAAGVTAVREVVERAAARRDLRGCAISVDVDPQ